MDASGMGLSEPIKLALCRQGTDSQLWFVLKQRGIPSNTNLCRGRRFPLSMMKPKSPICRKVRRYQHHKGGQGDGAYPQKGDASLYGAKYEIRDAEGTVVDTLTATGTRVMRPSPCPWVFFQIVEVESPEGYLKADPITVEIQYGGQEVEVTAASATVQDEVIKGRIRLVKFDRELGAGTPEDPQTKSRLWKAFSLRCD